MRDRLSRCAASSTVNRKRVVTSCIMMSLANQLKRQIIVIILACEPVNLVVVAVLQNLPFYVEASKAFGSCFFRSLAPACVGSFTRGFRFAPALPTPQAFALSGELSANFAKLSAAFRSLSRTRPHCSQRKTRSASVKSSFIQLQPLQVLL